MCHFNIISTFQIIYIFLMLSKLAKLLINSVKELILYLHKVV